jgi:hypothetical protein
MDTSVCLLAADYGTQRPAFGHLALPLIHSALSPRKRHQRPTFEDEDGHSSSRFDPALFDANPGNFRTATVHVLLAPIDSRCSGLLSLHGPELVRLNSPTSGQPVPIGQLQMEFFSHQISAVLVLRGLS